MAGRALNEYIPVDAQQPPAYTCPRPEKQNAHAQSPSGRGVPMTMQRHQTITKPSTPRDDPNLRDYDATRASFDWASAESEIDGLPNGGLNLAYEAIDRHVAHGLGAKPAMLWEGKNGEKETYTYDDMRRETNKFANVLRSLGVEKGERVFTFMERIPEIYFSVFGALKAGCIIGPLFSAFGPDPVRDRMENSGATVLITQPDLRRKIESILPQLPNLRHIIVVNKNQRSAEPLAEGDLDYDVLMADASDDFGPLDTTRDDFLHHALHLRHHRQAQGRGPPAQRRHPALPHRQVVPRSAPQRRLLGVPLTPDG